jgi:periplasmic divalent cation tolerance protein
MESTVVLVYCTCPDANQAERLGRTLVEEQLAACINILPGMRSVYRWEGVVETADEAVLIVKTAAEGVDVVITRVRQLHAYTEPCILVLPVVGGSPTYLAWLLTNSKP